MGRFDALTQLEQTPEQKAPSPVGAPSPSQTVPSPETKKTRTERKKASPAPSPRPETPLDTTLLTSKEKTKYGTYLTDESIEKINIRAIQMKRDSHQVVQEAINNYFDTLKK
jgi:hypothetical protein